MSARQATTRVRSMIRAPRWSAMLLAVAVIFLSGCSESPLEPELPERFTRVSAGYEHTCVTGEGGGIWCFGNSRLVRLGFPSSQPPCDGSICVRPVPATSLPLQQVSAGNQHNCGILRATAYCWGFDWKGQLGDAGTVTQRCGVLLCSIVPVPVALGFPITGISAGAEHSCAITASGEAYCWGRAASGQLGDGLSRDSTLTPSAVAGGHRFSAISAGRAHTCAIDLDGHAWCWGAGGSGQLGSGAMQGSPVPVPVVGDPSNPGPLSWRVIAAGVAHTCGVATDGEVYCFGRGQRGALGDGRGESSAVPVRVEIPEAAALDVAAGDVHSCALITTGAIYCWGGNDKAQLGNADTSDRLSPVRVHGNLDFAQLSVGARHSCGLTHDGSVYCWGENWFGQLGVGDRATRVVPERLRP